MVMTEACIHVATMHDRMPVLLRRKDWIDWLDGAPDAAGLLCRPYPDLMVVDRTTDPLGTTRLFGMAISGLAANDPLTTFSITVRGSLAEQPVIQRASV